MELISLMLDEVADSLKPLGELKNIRVVCGCVKKNNGVERSE